MTGMLASVNSLNEALLAERFEVDVIDLKQPEYGALGALDIHSVRQIVTALRPETVISATIGDLPMSPEIVASATQTMAATGVDYVKIGFFPDGYWPACIDALAPIANQQSLIAVLFADTRIELAVVDRLAEAGFRGVMLDTMDKTRGSLTQILSDTELRTFVRLAKSQGLLTGLAGSLRQADIAPLVAIGADYLGFRGALCHQHRRTSGLDSKQVAAIRLRLNSNKPKMIPPNSARLQAQLPNSDA